MKRKLKLLVPIIFCVLGIAVAYNALQKPKPKYDPYKGCTEVSSVTPDTVSDHRIEVEIGFDNPNIDKCIKRYALSKDSTVALHAPIFFIATAEEDDDYCEQLDPINAIDTTEAKLTGARIYRGIVKKIVRCPYPLQ